MRRQIIIGPDTKIVYLGGRPPRMVLLLLGLQIGLFLVWAFADGPAWVALHIGASAAQCWGQLELWQPATALFIHLGSRSMLLNALTLWLFGSPLERWWGGRRLLIFWLVTGILGLMFGVLVGLLQPAYVLSGSGGAAVALMVAMALLFPRHLVFFYGVLPLQAKHFSLFLLGFTVLGNLFSQSYLEIALEVGGGAAALFFLLRRSRPSAASAVTDKAKRKLRLVSDDKVKKDSKRYMN